MTVFWSRAALGVLGALMVWGLVGGFSSGSTADTDAGSESSDRDLYAAVADRVSDGEDYYAAVAQEQADRGYPTRPTPTVREPVVTWIVAGLGEDGAQHLQRGLAAVALVVGSVFLARAIHRPALWAVSVLLLLVGLAPQFFAVLFYFHETWAAPLVIIGLLSRRAGGSNWWSALALTVAASVRELAAPVLLVVAALAWRSGRRQEAGAMLFGFVVWASFYAWHIGQVANSVPPSGHDSPGWLALGGWPFAVEALSFGSGLAALPLVTSAVLVPSAVVGWTALVGRGGPTVALVLAGYAAAVALMARPDNVYWGLVMTPLMLPGLALAPGALRDLMVAARPRSAMTPTN